MRHAVVAVGLVGLVVLASLSLQRQHASVEDLPGLAQPADGIPVATRAPATEDDAVSDRSDAPRTPTSIDLRSVSQTFRNSTLLFGIRRAGFYCADVVSAYESADGVWLASCSDMLGYIVTLRGGEQFDVQPVAQYFDGVAPVPVDRDRSLEPRLLEPRSLVPQPLPK